MLAYILIKMMIIATMAFQQDFINDRPNYSRIIVDEACDVEVCDMLY